MHSGTSSAALTDRFTPTSGSLDNLGNVLFPINMQKYESIVEVQSL